MTPTFSGIPPRNRLLFVVMLTAFVLPWDGCVTVSLLHQLGTVRYVGSADGLITSSELVGTYTNKGTRYKLEVSYAYKVGGHDYQGSRISYSFIQNNPDLAPRFPPGGHVRVFYLPRQPEEAILIRGLQGEDLRQLLWLFPLNLGWLLAVRAWRNMGTLGLRRIKGRTHVPLSAGDQYPWYGMIFVSFLIGIFSLAGLDMPSLPMMASIWVGLLVLCGVARLWQRHLEASGRYSLIVDERHERLLLPAMYGRALQRELPFSRVLSLSSEYDFIPTKSGPLPYWTLVLTYRTPEGEQEETTLAQWMDEERVRALVTWLPERVGVHKPPAARRMPA